MTLRLGQNEYHALCKVVLSRDQYKCRVCGYRQELSAHHIVFRSHGGEDTTKNLLTLCNACHRAVHSGDLEIIIENDGADGTVWFTRHNNWRPK